MFEFGDDLTIEGYRVSWLIWIQVLVLLLLIFLLFCFSFFPADLPDTTTTSSSASPPALGVFTPLNSHLDNQILRHNDHVSNRLQHSQEFILPSYLLLHEKSLGTAEPKHKRGNDNEHRLEAELCGRENVDWSKADYPVTYMCFDIDLAIVLDGKLHSLSLMNCIVRL
ncbi:hypothetical protein POTOM_028447 [Populus tomentosa]|uniref:Uncharacterized protein n=1 Tax=Populus tomentosa TaxID=118781 RepID=A0A8X7ZGL7_POPTO|nr:hypothetical protein POTOM_028447 [Populus tomentosa]